MNCWSKSNCLPLAWPRVTCWPGWLQTTSLSSTTSTDSDSYYHKPTEEENKLFAGGIKRSKPFHTAELLQQQVGLSAQYSDMRYLGKQTDPA